jgi:6-phosphofructokinase 1
LEIIAKTPCAALGSVRKKPSKEECRKIFDIFKKYEVRYFFYIGGNDSAETANIINELARGASYEMRVFHVPKTIDNDLLVTDHCPGYGSAAKFVASAVMGDNQDNMSLPGIKIDVVMGRHAGFLTAAAALARVYEDDAPHLIYVPERPFIKEQFIADVDRIYNKLGRALIVVSEGIAGPNGEPVFTTGEKDSHGNVQLSGTGALGDFLSRVIKENLGEKLRVRADTFGYLQRSFSGMISEVDAKEAGEVGRMAIKFALEGEEDQGSVAIKRVKDNYEVEYFRTDLKNVAKNTKSLPDNFINKEGNNVTEEFLNYSRPLAGQMPQVKRLKGVKVG